MDRLDRYLEIIPDLSRLKEIHSQPLPASVRINTLKTDRSRLQERFERAGIGWRELGWYPMGLRLDVRRPGKLLEHMLGYIHVQEEISMVPPLILGAQPGEEVLDLCAAPGSKTTQISQQMNNRGLIIANEPSLGRIAPLRSNCERLGVMNVAITRYDGRHFPDHLFHRILVDAPCSMEGMARKDPGVLNRSSGGRSQDLQSLQMGLLRRALMLARPGGVVVYSTCTYAPEENEAVVNSVLDCAYLEKVSISGLQGSPGLTEWNGTQFSEALKRCARYYPHQNDTGGFFVAKLIKS